MHLLGLKTEEMEGGRTRSSSEMRGKNCSCTRRSRLKSMGCFVTQLGNAGHASSAKQQFHAHTVSLDPLPIVHD